MDVVPVSLQVANAFVDQVHRHHKPVVGHLFSLGLRDEQWVLRGVAIVGRPVARMLQDGVTMEVTRLCTDGTRNACSQLYGAAWREARRRGCTRMITYILESENGASLRASGWIKVAFVKGQGWGRPSRPRKEPSVWQLSDKFRYERTCHINQQAQHVTGARHVLGGTL